MNFQHKIAWISEARFKPYLDECSGDEGKAWALYEWNARVSSALSECIHHVEVLLRNAMVRELEKLHPLEYPWHMDNSVVSNIVSKRRKSNGQPVSADDLIGNLNLGYWKQLLQDKPVENEELWRSTLKNAFPHSRIDRPTALNAVEDLFEVRNRCAHQDSLLGFDPSVELKKIIKLARWIDSDAGDWISSIEQVSKAITERPIPPKMDVVIIGGSSDQSYQIYKRVNALINPTSRKIGPVKYVGFYHSKQIEPDFPKIMTITVPTVWSAAEAARLKKTSSPHDKALGKIMSYAISQGLDSKEGYEVYMLTPTDHDETLHTSSGNPIRHDRSGRGTAFVKGGRRYFSSSTIVAVSNTSELE